jgi:hypothetical protein
MAAPFRRKATWSRRSEAKLALPETDCQFLYIRAHQHGFVPILSTLYPFLCPAHVPGYPASSCPLRVLGDFFNADSGVHFTPTFLKVAMGSPCRSGLASLLSVLLFCGLAAAAQPPSSGFIRVSNGRFVDANCREFLFSGGSLGESFTRHYRAPFWQGVHGKVGPICRLEWVEAAGLRSQQSHPLWRVPVRPV